MYKYDLELKILQGLICHKTQRTKLNVFPNLRIVLSTGFTFSFGILVMRKMF